MKIANCIKGFDQGISKVIPPEETFKIALKKIGDMHPPILRGYHKMYRESGIPQYRFIGTDYFGKVALGHTGTNGKGHFRGQALASGIMELAERYSCYRYLNDPGNMHILSFDELKNNPFTANDLYSFYPRGLEPKALEYREFKKAKIRWYEGYDLEGRKVYLPAYLLSHIIQGTNGMAAGNSLEEALIHGICEVIERHCLTLINVHGLPTPLIKPDSIKGDIENKLLKKLTDAKQQIFIKDFSLGIGLPVLGVIRVLDNSNCIISAGVATTKEEALIRALTENSQIETKKNYRKIHLSRHYFNNAQVISFRDINNASNKNMRLELENIENILARKSMRIFFCDTTEKKLDIPSVLVFITGAKFCGPSKEIFWRNVTTGLIEESFFLRDYSQAEKYINKAGFLFKPDRTNYMYYRGRFLFLGKRYGEAAKFFRAVLNKTRLDALRESALIFLVYIYLKLKEKNKALKFYIKTLNLFPETYGFNDYEKFYLDTAYLKNSGNKTGLSGISFDNYLRKKSRYAKLFEKAQSYYYAEKYAEAIAAAKRAIKLMPMEVDAYLLLGSSYENTGCDKMALAIHEKAAAIVLKFSAIYLPLARLYLKLKKYKAAIAVANKIMTSGFKEERVHFLLGTCYGKTRQYLKAIGQLKKAEEINPFEPQINFSLFNCYRMTGRTGLARVELEKFIFKSKRKTIFNI